MEDAGEIYPPLWRDEEMLHKAKSFGTVDEMCKSGVSLAWLDLTMEDAPVLFPFDADDDRVKHIKGNVELVAESIWRTLLERGEDIEKETRDDEMAAGRQEVERRGLLRCISLCFPREEKSQRIVDEDDNNAIAILRKALPTAYSSFKHLEWIIVVAKNLGVEVSQLAEALKHPGEELQQLCGLLESQALHLDALVLEVTPPLSAPLCMALATSLTILELRRCDLGKGRIEPLTTALTSPRCKLRTLVLRRNGLGEEDAKSLSGALASPNCSLERLGIYYSKIGSEWVKCLGRALQSPSCSIHSLALWWFVVDQTEAWASLEDAIMSPDCKLVELHLGLAPGQISPGFFEALRSPHCRLKYLTLPGFDQVRETAESIKGSDNLRYFNFQSIGSKDDCVLLEAIIDSKITHLVLGSLRPSNVEAVCKLLANPRCNLQSFILDWYGFIASVQERILDAVDSNYQSRLETLGIGREWQSSALALKCSHLMKRNALFQKGALAGRGFVKASTAKLFICGHTGVGKTTIQRNLRRSFAPSNCFQQYSSTQGIQVRPLVFGSNKLTMCDLAGQQAYHAFHHYFMRGSERDLFLVVCKVDQRTSQQDFEDLLIYWLRFIVSHQSSSPMKKPKVFIALNFFSMKDGGDYKEATIRVANHYSERIDFGEADEMNIFEVVALHMKDVKLLKERIGVALEDLVSRHPEIPKLCQDVKLEFDNSQRQKKWFKHWSPCLISTSQGQQPLRVVELKSLADKLLPGEDDETVTRSVVEFTLACLHDMGEAIYFGLEHQDDIELSKYAILDVQWFVHEVVGLFIHKLERDDLENTTGRASKKIEEFKNPLIRKCGKDHLCYILRSLHEMGVLLPWDPKWQGTWSPSTLPSEVVVPTLLKTKFTGWDEQQSLQYEYWGRRLECRDREFTLLPSGIFGMIQVKVRELCKNNSFQLGDGWVSFKENGVGVVVRVGGARGKWIDRQWVDVMVMVPVDGKKCLEADEMTTKIKDCISNICTGCPYLKLEEMIMKPVYVKHKVLALAEDQGPTSLASLADVKENLETKGLTYTFTWDARSENEIGELLMPSELKQHFSKKMKTLRDDYEECARHFQTPPMDPVLTIEKKVLPTFENKDFEKLIQYLVEREVEWKTDVFEIKSDLKDIKADLKDMKQALKQIQERMDVYGKKILANCSNILQKIDVQCPRYPYLVDEYNKLQKYCTLLGKKAQIHYMCESPNQNHHVSGYPGVEFIVAHEWLHEAAPVLVPALTILSFTIKIGGPALGPIGEIIGSTVDSMKGGLIDFLKSSFDGATRFDLSGLDATQIERAFKHVQERVEGGELNTDTLMSKYFGLHYETFGGGKRGWVCQKCSRLY